MNLQRCPSLMGPCAQAEIVEIIRSSGEILLALINDVLDLSKVEAGTLQLDYQVRATRVIMFSSPREALMVSKAFDLRQCLEGALDVLATHPHVRLGG